MISKILSQINKELIPNEGYSFIKYNNFYWGYDFDENISFGIESILKNNEKPLKIATKYLTLSYNTEFKVNISDENTNKRMHIITLRNNEKNIIDTFLELSIIFQSEDFKDDKKFIDFFTNLKILFERDIVKKTELQGLYGELVSILYLNNELEINLTSYYQRIERELFDFSISDIKKIEVKTTNGFIRTHKFKQEQLNVDMYDIIVVSIILEKTRMPGMSLFDLIEKCKNNIKNKNHIFFTYLKWCLSKYDEDQIKETKYDFSKALNSVSFYKANDIPRIFEEITEGVSNVEFVSDLTNIKKMSSSEVKNWIESK